MQLGILLSNTDGCPILQDMSDGNSIKDYLFNSAIFDTPSRSRHEYGTLYEEDTHLKIKLNLQVRLNPLAVKDVKQMCLF